MDRDRLANLTNINRYAFTKYVLVIDFIHFDSGSSHAMIWDKFSVGGHCLFHLVMYIYVLAQASMESLEHDLPKSYKFEGTIGWICMLLKSWLEPKHTGLKCTTLWDSVGQAPCRRPVMKSMMKGNKGNRKNSWLTACPNIPLPSYPLEFMKSLPSFPLFQNAWLWFCGCKLSVL